MVEVPLGPGGAGGKEMEKNTDCALGSPALGSQPGTLPTCLCISHHHDNVFPAGVSSPCTVRVSVSTGHSWVSQGPRVGAVYHPQLGHQGHTASWTRQWPVGSGWAVLGLRGTDWAQLGLGRPRLLDPWGAQRALLTSPAPLPGLPDHGTRAELSHRPATEQGALWHRSDPGVETGDGTAASPPRPAPQPGATGCASLRTPGSTARPGRGSEAYLGLGLQLLWCELLWPLRIPHPWRFPPNRPGAAFGEERGTESMSESPRKDKQYALHLALWL